jgi:ribosomal subunit interface protein
MRLDIKGSDLEVTDAIRAFTEEKMSALDPKIARFGESVDAEVELSRTTGHHNKGEVYRAEVHVRLPGKLVYAAADHEDLYVAINDARKEAERQIIDYKEMLADHNQEEGLAAKNEGGLDEEDVA